MLRLILAASLALGSVSAIASPKLGDLAVYSGTITLAGQVTEVTASLEVVQQDGTKFLQRTTVNKPGQPPKVTDEWKEAETMLGDTQIDEILANCAAQGGRAGSIAVPAGTFEACEASFDDDEAQGADWIAKVPFGIVKSAYVLKADGKAVELLLKSFK